MKTRRSLASIRQAMKTMTTTIFIAPLTTRWSIATALSTASKGALSTAGVAARQPITNSKPNRIASPAGWPFWRRSPGCGNRSPSAQLSLGAGQPAISDGLAAWRERAARGNRRRLGQLAVAVSQQSIARPTASYESLVEFDRRMNVKESLSEKVIATWLAMDDAKQFLTAAEKSLDARRLRNRRRHSSGQR